MNPITLDAHDPFAELYEVGPALEVFCTDTTTYRITLTRATREGAHWDATFDERAMPPQGPWVPVIGVASSYGNTPDECFRNALTWLRQYHNRRPAK